MSREERERLRDIRGAIDAIRRHLGRVKPASREDDALLHDAILFQFVVIGEAVKPPRFRDARIGAGRPMD